MNEKFYEEINKIEVRRVAKTHAKTSTVTNGWLNIPYSITLGLCGNLIEYRSGINLIKRNKFLKIKL